MDWTCNFIEWIVYHLKGNIQFLWRACYYVQRTIKSLDRTIHWYYFMTSEGIRVILILNKINLIVKWCVGIRSIERTLNSFKNHLLLLFFISISHHYDRLVILSWISFIRLSSLFIQRSLRRSFYSEPACYCIWSD